MSLLLFFLLAVIIYIVLLYFLSRDLPTEILDVPLNEDETTLSFGKDFSFGTSTSAWQIEKEVGKSNWSVGETIERNGKKLIPPHGEEVCDAFNHFDEDLRLMSSMRMKKYRFSVSWSAIEREKGKYDEGYLQNYVTMCEKLRMNNIEPMVTLLHFEHPEWVEKEGGVFAENFLEYFTNFTNFVVNG